MKKSLIMIIFLAFIMVPAVLPAAEPAGKTDPLAGAVEFGSEENHAGRVWKSGRIDLIHEDGVVIGDIGYRFTEDTKFYSAGGTALSWMNFHAGTMVKLVLEKDLKRVASLIKQ